MNLHVIFYFLLLCHPHITCSSLFLLLTVILVSPPPPPPPFFYFLLLPSPFLSELYVRDGLLGAAVPPWPVMTFPAKRLSE